MKCIVLSLAGAGLMAVLAFGVATAQNAPPKGDAAHGKKIYVAYGCYQCHGFQGQGAAAGGPKLAPTPLPYAAVMQQLRKPRNVMPVYTHVTTPDQDVADIYAYLQSIPKAKTVAEIPLLADVK
jgi:mono/diheme cytochrome c family protein